MFDVINNLIQMEGYKGFYSGVASPLIGKIYKSYTLNLYM